MAMSPRELTLGQAMETRGHRVPLWGIQGGVRRNFPVDYLATIWPLSTSGADELGHPLLGGEGLDDLAHGGAVLFIQFTKQPDFF